MQGLLLKELDSPGPNDIQFLISMYSSQWFMAEYFLKILAV